MNHRALLSLTHEVRGELGSTRAALEAFARAAYERRELAPETSWPRSGRLDQPDVEALLARDDVLGAAYQALNAPALEAAYRATARDGRKFTPEEIPSVTGLFTPGWVAEFLLRETLGPTWAERRTPVCGIRLLDPACGTMNVGLAAVDVFREMYREEMDHAGRPGWPGEPSVGDDVEIGPAILRHNLFGVDIDPTALWLARLSLGMKLRIGSADVEANLTEADALFDAIAGGFDAVVTNPPYLSARNLPARAVARLKKRFPSGWRDLYACFIDRCLQLCRPGGRVGMLTMQSFMFTGAFERLREHVDEHAAIETIAHFGPGLFEGGNPGTLQTVAFTLRREDDPDARARQQVVAYRLTDLADPCAKSDGLARAQADFPPAVARASRPRLIRCEDAGETPAPPGGTNPRRFDVRQADLATLPRRAWAYWASPAARRAFAGMPRLRDVAPPRQGLATTDNARFVRFWWEVEPTAPDVPLRATSGRWSPYSKSGRFRRWYEAPRHRVNWQDDGREIKAEIVRRYPYLGGDWQWVAKNASWYGKPGGVTYSYLTSGRFSARRLEPGSIFDVAGSSLFPAGNALAMLAILNSSVAAELLHVINPTVNFQVGDLAELPVPAGEHPALAGLAGEAIALQRRLDTFDETSPDFRQPPVWADAEEIVEDLRRRLEQVEAQVDRDVSELYEMRPPSPLHSRERGLQSQIRNLRSEISDVRADLARRWVSFGLGRLLGRWGGAAPREPFVRIRPTSTRLLNLIRAELAAHAGAAAVGEIDLSVGGLARFLETDFYPWHVRLYARRPVYWCFGSGDRALLVPHDRADSLTMAHVLRQVGESPPAGWTRCVDDGLAVSLAPFAGLVSDPSLATALGKFREDLLAGRFGWSESARGLSPKSTGGSAPAPRRRRRRLAAPTAGPRAART